MVKKSHSLSVTLSAWSKPVSAEDPRSPTRPRAQSQIDGNPDDQEAMRDRKPPRPETSANRQPPVVRPPEVVGSNMGLQLPLPFEQLHPEMPPPTATPPRKERDRGRSFFGSYHRSRSANRLHPRDATIRKVSEGDHSGPEPDPVTTLYHHPKSIGSSPGLATITNLPAPEPKELTVRTAATTGKLAVDANVVDRSAAAAAMGKAPKKSKHKPRPFAHLLGRTRSIRTDAVEHPPPKTTGHSRFMTSETAVPTIEDPSLKTAPLHQEGDRSFRDMMTSGLRNRSADRKLPAESESNGSVTASKEHGKHHPTFPSALRDGTGSVFSNLKSSSSKAADGLGRAGKGFFGKLARSGSSGEKEKEAVSDENYVFTVINLPLVLQTRRTRISKQYEQLKDKTEYWMPALPYRCIDYLNDKGYEEEGLYRIPGSGYKVKRWQRRFDTELDIDLFNQPDLYDINIIGSMLKAWLRELPGELLPKGIQSRIAKECAGAEAVPQMLKDELSKLPPYNYYLLFAITCHLSLLHKYVEKNKMNYQNLCICFQPCLKMDGFCFHFLVREWKHCWQGCWTEQEALAEERRILMGPPLIGPEPSTAGFHDGADERAVSSSESSQTPSFKPGAEKIDDTKCVPVVITEVPQTPPMPQTPPKTPMTLSTLSTHEEQTPSVKGAESLDDAGDNTTPFRPSSPVPLPSLSPLAPLSPLKM
ncbi:MAG: hypothetical protein M1826_006250 [Phylliscum demangeonii]|nr:MAG: hypothetical protein M1826_006250 [Phylliscum demangeonii]